MAIKLIDEISMDSFKDFVEKVEAIMAEPDWDCEPIQVDLFSHGGSAEAALAFYSYMRLNPEVSYHITAYGEVASSAVLVLACGHKRRMTKEAWVMVHESSFKAGKLSSSGYEEMGRQLRRMEDQWNELLAERTKATASYWGSIHKETTYLSAEECLELGLVDEII